MKKFDQSQLHNCKVNNVHKTASFGCHEQSKTHDTSNLSLRGPIVNYPGFTQIDHCLEKGILRLRKGSKFAVLLLTPISSVSSKVGEFVSAMVLSSINVNNKIVIPTGSLLTGWVSKIHGERSVLQSKLSSTRWRNSHAAVALHFNELHMAGNRVIKISASPAKGSPISLASGEFALKVNKFSEIEIDFSGAKYGAAAVAIQAASWATGPFKLVVGPVLSGTTGVIDPAYALDRPVNDPDCHRVEGLLNGIVKGLPGGGLALGAKHRGICVDLAKGTEIQVELNQDLAILENVKSDTRARNLAF